MDKADVQFETRINGVRYLFCGWEAVDFWIFEAYLNARFVNQSRDALEENAILKLVKLLESEN